MLWQHYKGHCWCDQSSDNYSRSDMHILQWVIHTRTSQHTSGRGPHLGTYLRAATTWAPASPYKTVPHAFLGSKHMPVPAQTARPFKQVLLPDTLVFLRPARHSKGVGLVAHANSTCVTTCVHHQAPPQNGGSVPGGPCVILTLSDNKQLSRKPGPTTNAAWVAQQCLCTECSCHLEQQLASSPAAVVAAGCCKHACRPPQRPADNERHQATAADSVAKHPHELMPARSTYVYQVCVHDSIARPLQGNKGVGSCV